jgi:hypothetical protein
MEYKGGNFCEEVLGVSWRKGIGLLRGSKAGWTKGRELEVLVGGG